MASSLNGTGVTFSDGSTIASASTFGAIGSTGFFFCSYSSILNVGDTISGSYLFYVSSSSTAYPAYNVGSAGSTYMPTVIVWSNANRNNVTTTTTGASSWNGNATLTNISGTWRYMGPTKNTLSFYGSYYNQTHWATGLFVRVS